jgi:hypothetical protein
MNGRDLIPKYMYQHNRSVWRRMLPQLFEAAAGMRALEKIITRIARSGELRKVRFN